MIIRKKIKIILIFIVIVVLSIAIFLGLKPNDSNVLFDGEFIIGFIGVILGVDIAIITFIYSSLDKIEEYIDKRFQDCEKIKKQRLTNCYIHRSKS